VDASSAAPAFVRAVSVETEFLAFKMSRLFKGKTCVYCAVPGAADTGDHVLARQFVAVAHRGQIPKVPACSVCNGKKAALESYLMAVLPFGGRHADALNNLTANVPMPDKPTIVAPAPFQVRGWRSRSRVATYWGL
jgi:hypothetical protein